MKGSGTFVTPAALLLAALALAGCDRSPTDDDSAPPMASAPAAVSIAAEAAPVVATETTMARSGVQPVTGAIDQKAFAGPFEGTLPCADCPAIDERLVLSADGSYSLTDAYRERPGSDNVVEGSWSLEADGRSIRLDPGSKDAVDRMYAIADNDTLLPLDADGQPLGDGREHALRRSR